MTKRWIGVLLGVALALSPAFTGGVGAQEEASVPVNQAEGGWLWFVELNGAPVAQDKKGITC